MVALAALDMASMCCFMESQLEKKREKNGTNSCLHWWMFAFGTNSCLPLVQTHVCLWYKLMFAFGTNSCLHSVPIL
jgi:hypothetical protein